MNRIALVLACLMVVCSVSVTKAQLGIGSSINFAGGPKPWADGDLEALKKTKTVFVYGSRDVEELENWKKVMSDVWTITPVEFVSYEKLDDYKEKPGYSFISIRFWDRSVTDNEPWKKPSQGGGMSVSIMNTFLELGMPKVVDGKKKYVNFFRLELYPTSNTLFHMLSGKEDNPLAYAYTDARFHNYYPGLQKHLLQQANKLLTEGKSRKLYALEKDVAKLAAVKTETLFLPDYILIDYNRMSGDESKRFTAEEITKSYPYKYEILPAKRLSDKIVNGEKILYMVHTKSSTDNYFSVFNGNGDWVYSRYKAVSYVVKDDDLEHIAKTASEK